MIVKTAAQAVSAIASDGAFPSQTWESRTARLVARCRWGRAGAVITTHGEVDAANARQLVDFIDHCLNYCEWLVVDLSGLDFIGTVGLSALHQVQDRCAAVGVNWALVPSPAVSKVLQFGEPDRALPISESLAEALVTVQNQSRRLQLVAQ
ncbi:MAG: STAS domain-containing protein [Mycobacterium sp.]